VLRPTKHDSPDETVLAAATVVLRELQAHGAVVFDELKSTLATQCKSADYLLTPALSLLYLLGLVEYYPIEDLIEYRGAT